MASPLVLVAALTVLWLVVVVPMIARRGEARTGRRSARVGGAMRALAGRPAARRRASGDADLEETPMNGWRDADTGQLSAGRRRMIARRRRSLFTLGVGSVLSVVLAVLLGGVSWLVTAPFVLGLGGYLLFLRNQARRDRVRQATREDRASARGGRRPLVSVAAGDRFGDEPMSYVRIDDDDIALHMHDTVDLTEFYDGPRIDVPAQRRAG